MTIKLEKLVSELYFDTSGFESGKKVALAATAAIAAGVTAAIGAVSLAVKATFDWAQEMDSLQDVMGGTNKQAAALNFVLRKSGTDTEKLTKGMTIFEKQLSSSRVEWHLSAKEAKKLGVAQNGAYTIVGKSGEAMKKYGLSVLDANGKIKDQTGLVQEISDRYDKFGTQQERVKFLTDLFGKSGAELIDFFDTLAQEGGIDAVTKKVEAFGLAIDPARYEQFNRNLEELKLIGTGLAVQFTEKLMPALESVLSWFGKEAPKAADAFKQGGLGGLADFILTELGDLDTELAAKLDSVNWAKLGTQFGDWVDDQFTNGFGQHSLLPKFVISLTDGLSDSLLHAALGADPKAAWAAFFDNVHREGDSSTRTFFIDWEISWTKGIRDFFDNWETEWTNGIRKVYNFIVTWLNKIDALFGNNSNIPTLPMMNTPNSGGGGSNTRRASGGAVIAGQAYDVSEFYKPEKFTPNTSGRVDPIKNQAIDENKIGDAIGRRLIRDLPPLLQMMKA